MAEKNFAITPSVSISRSKFLRTNTHKTSFNLGEIIPLYVDEVLPGDTRSIDVASLVRMSTPIAPIMDDIEMELFAFFVPNRIVWKDWKQFMGENPAAGYSAFAGTFPYINVKLKDLGANSIGNYMGLPYNGSGNTNVKFSALPLRGYLAIYNRWFRDQNVEGACFVDDTDGADVSTDPVGAVYGYIDTPLIAFKKSDFFTRALPYAQKGAPVTLPLGATAPVITAASDHLTSLSTNTMNWATYVGGTWSKVNQPQDVVLNGSGATVEGGQAYLDNFGSAMVPSNLVADLSKATAATINQLREAFQLQKLLEKDALYGTRYWELLYGHFGVRSPDATLQDPEYLGGTKFMINIDQVLSTAGYAAGTTTDVGKPGANSVTGNKGSLFTKSFVEHGHIFILGVARQARHTYSQGIMPMWQRFDRYDYYWPEFANLGAQELKKKVLFATGNAADDTTFGYQEAWADYRYKPSQVSGLMNPNQPSSLSFWSLAEALPSAPTLSTSFLKEDRTNLARCLTTSTTGPDFIADFYFRDTAVRPLPMYSIPGLIDHH